MLSQWWRIFVGWLRGEEHPGEDPRDRGAGERRAAAVVFHGMGQQQRYSTLDSVARGLARAVGRSAHPPPGASDADDPGADGEDLGLAHEFVTLAGEDHVAVGVELSEPLPSSESTRLDVFELYWAPLAQRRVRLAAVVRWLARTSLTPLRAWATNPDLGPPGERVGRTQVGLLLRELRRALFLPVLLVVLLSPLVAAVGFRGRLAAVGRQLGDGLLSRFTALSTGVDLVLPILLGLVALWLVAVALRLMVRQVGAEPVEEPTFVPRILVSLVIAALAGGAAVAIELNGELHAADYLSEVWTAVGGQWRWAVLGGIGAVVLVASLLSTFLVSALGDVALYVTSDENSELYATRAAILEDAVTLVRAILRSPDYAEVVLIGHSLGSVVAYDTVNQLQRLVPSRAGGGVSRRRRPASANTLSRECYDKLSGLVTFGSPLDKVDYFFRTRVGDREAIRAQLLASLHGFRREATNRNYGPFRLDRYAIPEPTAFWWLNVWARADPVSGHLDRYRLHERDQIHLDYSGWRYGVAHTAYWDDPRLYEVIRERWYAS